jgi:hypothetical protein
MMKAVHLLLLLSVSILASEGLEVRFGPIITSLSPTDDTFEERFLTPGYSIGVIADLDAPGPIMFQLGFESFRKDASAGWDGKLDAILISAFPCFRLPVYRGFSIHAGPGAVFTDGNYSGTDDFGSFVEASGSSVGFGFTAGADIHIWGPLSTRLSYRRVFMDMKTDRADIDGTESFIYPAAETDLGYAQFSLSVIASVFGREGSLF